LDQATRRASGEADALPLWCATDCEAPAPRGSWDRRAKF
jgi:hypothetical protein